MRASLIPLFIYYPLKLPCTAYSLQVLQTLRQNVCSAFLPLKGLFWTGVGGVQVVNLAAKAQDLRRQRQRLVWAGAHPRHVQPRLFLEVSHVSRSGNGAPILV